MNGHLPCLLLSALLPLAWAYQFNQIPSRTNVTLEPLESARYSFMVCDPELYYPHLYLRYTFVDGNISTPNPIENGTSELLFNEEIEMRGYAQTLLIWNASNGSRCGELVSRIWNGGPGLAGVTRILLRPGRPRNRTQPTVMFNIELLAAPAQSVCPSMRYSFTTSSPYPATSYAPSIVTTQPTELPDTTATITVGINDSGITDTRKEVPESSKECTIAYAFMAVMGLALFILVVIIIIIILCFKKKNIKLMKVHTKSADSATEKEKLEDKEKTDFVDKFIQDKEKFILEKEEFILEEKKFVQEKEESDKKIKSEWEKLKLERDNLEKERESFKKPTKTTKTGGGGPDATNDSRANVQHNVTFVIPSKKLGYK